MGGAEQRPGQVRPFGRPNLSPDGVGGSGGARGGETTEHIIRINPESVSLGQEFQLFNPLSTVSFTVLRYNEAWGLPPNNNYYSFTILRTDFSPLIPFFVAASNWGDPGLYTNLAITPLNPEVSHRVNTKDFTLSSRIEQYLQAPDSRIGERHKLAPLRLKVKNVNEYSTRYYDVNEDNPMHFTTPEMKDRSEYLEKLYEEFSVWFRDTPDNQKLIQNLFFRLHSPSMELASYPDEYKIPNGEVNFDWFFPTDTGRLPYDANEMTRRSIFEHLTVGIGYHAFEDGYRVEVPDDLEALSLLRGSFNQLPS